VLGGPGARFRGHFPAERARGDLNSRKLHRKPHERAPLSEERTHGESLKPTDIGQPDYFHKVVDCQWACPAHTPVPNTSA
jgi:hypothetical protein